MEILNKKKVKQEFNKKGMKIGKRVIEKFIGLEEKEIKQAIERIVRNAKISGRKTIQQEDF